MPESVKVIKKEQYVVKVHRVSAVEYFVFICHPPPKQL